MTVAGIDYSSRAVDIVLLNDDTDHAAWTRVELHGATPIERARSLRGRLPLRSWWEDEGVYLIGIEDPYSRSKGVAKALGMAAGAIVALLPVDLTVIQTPPIEWKRLAIGNGSATKAQVANWARAELGHDGVTTWAQDAYDAYAIARAVRHLNNHAIAEGGRAA